MQRVAEMEKVSPQDFVNNCCYLKLPLESKIDAEICSERNGVFVYRRIKIIYKSFDGEFRIFTSFQRIYGF